MISHFLILQARIEGMPLQEEIPGEKFDWDQFYKFFKFGLKALKVLVPVTQKDWYLFILWLPYSLIYAIKENKKHLPIYSMHVLEFFVNWSNFVQQTNSEFSFIKNPQK